MNQLRDHISELKIKISTITKGVPITKIEVRESRSTSTARSRKSDKEKPNTLEDECSPERREKLRDMMETEIEKQVPDGRRSPLRILKSQQRSAREILMT